MSRMLINQFLEMLVSEKGAQKNSISSYLKDIEDLMEFLFSISVNNIADVRIQHLRDWIFFLSYTKKLSTRTIARKISAIRSYFYFLLSENIVQNNPAILLDLPKYTQKLPHTLTTDEIFCLIDQLKKGNDEHSARTLSMLSILYSTGMRVSEMLSIKCQDILLFDGNIRSNFIIKSKGAKERLIILNKETIGYIQSYLKFRSYFLQKSHFVANQYLFCSLSHQGYVTRQHFHAILKKSAHQANLNADKISPHTIRHTFATHLLNGGADLRVIQELLGHTSISTTQLYTHLDSRKLKEAIKKHPLA